MLADYPLISIGMSVRDGANTLRLSLQSIVNQSYENWELILIDDGSKDATSSVAAGFGDRRIRYFSDGQSLGLPVRLNQAIDAARGDYFARMDADDISYASRLERQCEFLRANPEIDLVGSWVLVFNNAGDVLGRRTGPSDHFSLCARPLGGFKMAHPTYMGRTEWFRKYRYDVGRLRCEDQDLLLRSYRASRFANIPLILLGYRESLTLKKSIASRRMMARALAREFWRQWRPDMALAAILGQISKSVFDYVAFTTGLEYRMLHHRYEPSSKEDCQEWARVWNSLHDSGNVDSRIGRL